MLHNRAHVTVPIENPVVFKDKLLEFYKDSTHFTLLDSNGHSDAYSSQLWLAGAGSAASLEVTTGDAFTQLRDFHATQVDWLLGFLSYDLKNELEQLSSKHEDTVAAPLLHFFVPEILFRYSAAGLEVAAHHTATVNAVALVNEILNHNDKHNAVSTLKSELTAIDTKDGYIAKVQDVRNHIYRGDIYEANFCTQFQASNVQLDALRAFKDLNAISSSPFSVYASLGALKIMCASPERYIKKEGASITSQPIKGTAKRSLSVLEDTFIKEQLAADPKERSENVMIVDLVRNDLSKIAAKGSVQVSELFKIYSFKQVHQMISTVTAQLVPELGFIDVLKATFPMGSMTGAPKLSAMNIIEQTESFKRGIYSGAIGYITPQGDMDFNVVIRTILYNTSNKNLSLSVGSAITAQAVPAREYDECLLKARALFEVLARQGVAFK